MRLIKALFIIPFMSSIVSCSKSDPIYGTWSGKSTGENSYIWIDGPSQHDKKQPSNGSKKYSRVVDLAVSKDECEIVFNSNFDDVADCTYSPDEKVIIIPRWRDDDSINDSGLMIVDLNESTLELENKFTRIFTDYDEDRFEMKGSEFYSLIKKD